jgi:hypothetical protein
MARVYGRHFLEVDSKFFESGFNGPLVGKLFIAAEEVFCDGRYAFMDRLKALVTSPRIGINVKHGSQYEAVNRFNLLATSNHPNALHLDAQDRRVFVHEVTAGKPPAGYFKRLYGWADDGGIDHLFTHLKTLDLADFDPYAPARMTESKQRMVDNSRSDLDRWIADLGYSDFPDICDLKELLLKAREACPTVAYKLQAHTLSSAFSKEGINTRRLPGSISGRPTVAAIRNKDFWSKQETGSWVTAWKSKLNTSYEEQAE